jgi:signal transduction histidine kinase
MRPAKLYTKILISFLVVLFITMMVIFALFHALPGKYFTAHWEDFTKARVLVIKEAVEDKIRSAPTTDLSENEPLKSFVRDFGKISGGKFWLQKPDNTIPVKSFAGEIPAIVPPFKAKRARVYGDMTVYYRRGWDYYAVTPVDLLRGEKGTVHVLFDPSKDATHPDRPEAVFAVGLFVIGLMAALLFVPVSKIINSRLKQLRRSALTISEGDLSHRAVVTGRDEIGELAQSFNQMADKAEMMIVNAREMTTSVSHELRAPLTRIRIAEEILREKMKSEDAAQYERYLDDIREDIETLDQLINRILEWSKRDIQASPLVMAPLDPAQLIRMLLNKLQPVIDRKQLEVVSDLSFSPPFSGDKEALATAFSNILNNAAKFTPEKGQIHVRMRPLSDSLEIRITNTFEKIIVEELSRVFIPFHRANLSRAGGSGLGLAIAKKIVDRHGGTIEASNAETGFEIRIALPRNP